MRDLLDLDVFQSHATPQPPRTEPHTKIKLAWTYLTFDNGSSVRFTSSSDEMILCHSDADDENYMVKMSANEFVDYLVEVRHRGNKG
jgi:hypothetical protein